MCRNSALAYSNNCHPRHSKGDIDAFATFACFYARRKVERLMDAPSAIRPTATHILLTGAGFSRNWGGMLAPEVFQYLLGCSELDEELRRLLLRDRSFEDVLMLRKGSCFEQADPCLFLRRLYIERTLQRVP